MSGYITWTPTQMAYLTAKSSMPKANTTEILNTLVNKVVAQVVNIPEINELVLDPAAKAKSSISTPPKSASEKAKPSAGIIITTQANALPLLLILFYLIVGAGVPPGSTTATPPSTTPTTTPTPPSTTPTTTPPSTTPPSKHSPSDGMIVYGPEFFISDDIEIDEVGDFSVEASATPPKKLDSSGSASGSDVEFSIHCDSDEAFDMETDTSFTIKGML